MRIMQAPRRRGGAARKGRYRFGHGDTTRHTHVWEHENFEEEQARWERGDPEYALICDAVRQAEAGGEASVHADQAKADWDARVAAQRRRNDAVQKAGHALKVGRTA
jgi:hypothetical protein